MVNVTNTTAASGGVSDSTIDSVLSILATAVALFCVIVCHFVVTPRMRRRSENREDPVSMSVQEIQDILNMVASSNPSPPTTLKQVSEFHFKWPDETDRGTASPSSSSPALPAPSNARTVDSDPSSDLSCVVCFEGERDAIVLNCGHGGLCLACGVKIWDSTRQCPMCRQRIIGLMRVVGRRGDLVRIARSHLYLCLSICGARASPVAQTFARA
mmetsp:Transcript_71125/g.189850  ORF Transcript_71125/g.189850 Transcript_71125/m.189850 type:complete len:214 (-) Transcript_71125:82-723(-)